jgi:hypothetical protein
MWQARRVAGPCIPAYKTVGEAIARSVTPGDLAFVDVGTQSSQMPYDLPPQVTLYAHHNIGIWQGEEQALSLARKNGVQHIFVFVLDKDGKSVVQIRRIDAETAATAHARS